MIKNKFRNDNRHNKDFVNFVLVQNRKAKIGHYSQAMFRIRQFCIYLDLNFRSSEEHFYIEKFFLKTSAFEVYCTLYTVQCTVGIQ